MGIQWLGPRLSLLSARVQSLVTELRSHKLCAQPEKKKKITQSLKERQFSQGDSHRYRSFGLT